jgi:hydroxymethylpyrimidine kinase/phosphomethylpyrimidine kinase
LNIALTIAGSDSGGGAGIQADLKTFHQFGIFGTSVVVAVTAQNTRGVSAVHPVPTDIVEAQIEAVASDLPPSACKTGMLATADVVDAVARSIQRHALPNYVLDPVMVATTGHRLLDRDAVLTMRDLLLPLATVATPNLDEATILTESDVNSIETMELAGKKLVTMGARAALIKGGHLNGESLVDVLVTSDNVRRIVHERVDSTSTHGTGCTLSAAIAAGLAQQLSLEVAVGNALDFVHKAIATAPGLGGGHGPLNHFVSPPDGN